uniref:Ig-like domain-containing protein n=1 Tax=Naja naja TaxID=35670 RepID=A0A8C6V927_NAJNA
AWIALSVSCGYSGNSPTVSISPTKMNPASPNILLLCTATGFYPLEIEVQWLKNGHLEEEGVAFREELQNGDWTYQLQVMLETQTQRGRDPPCGGKPRSSSCARSKLWTGIMGAVIGVAFLAVGLFSYLKSKKGESGGLQERLWGGDHLGGGLSSSTEDGQEGLLEEYLWELLFLEGLLREDT